MNAAKMEKAVAASSHLTALILWCFVAALAVGACGSDRDSSSSQGEVVTVDALPTSVSAAPSSDAAASADATPNDATVEPESDAGVDAAEGDDTSEPERDITENRSDAGSDPAPDPTAVFFEPDHVLEVSIEIDPGDWDELRSQSRSFFDILAGADCMESPPEDIFTYFPATVTIDGDTVENVGVRKKGFFGSLSESKPALKIKLDEYAEGQSLSGMTRFTLNNSKQDPSHLNTCMTYGIFNRAGYPSPRCNFAHVTVNGQALGVYVHVDSIKKPFLKRVFDEDGGNLYEGTLSDFRPGWTGTMEKKTNKIEDDWSDVEAAVEALENEDSDWLEGVEALFDVDAFLTFWALEVLVGHWDGYNGNVNNFYFYRVPSTERFVFLPWGPDSSFKELKNPFMEVDFPASVVANSTFSNRLYADEDMRDAYAERMLSLVDEVWDEAFLLDEVDRMEALITPYMAPEVADAASNDMHRIRTFIQFQGEVIAEELSGDPPSWYLPLRDIPCWVEKGYFAATFETEWGTLESPNGLEIGEVTFSEYELDGEIVTPISSGATSGLDEDEGPASGRVLVSLISMLESSVIDILVIAVHPNWVQPGADIFMDGLLAVGYHLEFGGSGFGGEPTFVGFFAGGMLHFDEAEKTSGGTISGSVEAVLYAN